MVGLHRLGWSTTWVLTGEGPERFADLDPHAADSQTIATGDPHDPKVKAAWRRRDQTITDTTAGYQIGLETAAASQSLRLDRATLSRAVEILDLVLDLKGARVSRPQYVELLADTYEHLLRRARGESPSIDQITEISRDVVEKLQTIMGTA